jgi:hypothetical protein
MSTTFEKDVNNDIGLELVISVLSPFLNSGFISEYFNRVGKPLICINKAQIMY